MAEGTSQLNCLPLQGKLQSIHHIQSAEVFTNPHSKFKEIPDTDWGPHILYSLGPGFAPAHEVPMGGFTPTEEIGACSIHCPPAPRSLKHGISLPNVRMP
jgi:hypothetical protein